MDGNGMARLVEAAAFVKTNSTALRLLQELAANRKPMSTRDLLAAVGISRYSHNVLLRLEALGLVKRFEGEKCEGNVCFKVVYNVITSLGRQVLALLENGNCRET